MAGVAWLGVFGELGGWSTKAMVENYSHLSPGFVAQWIENSSIGTMAGTVDIGSDDEAPQVPDSMGWLMGLEPTTTGITTRDSTN